MDFSHTRSGNAPPQAYRIISVDNYQVLFRANMYFAVDKVRFYDETRRIAEIHITAGDEFVIPVSEKVFMRLKMEGH